MSKYTELEAKLADVTSDFNVIKNDRDFWKARAQESEKEITRLDIKLANKQPEKQEQTYLEKAIMALSAGDQTSGDVVELAERIEKYETERREKLERKARKAALKREADRAKAKAEFGLTEIISASEASWPMLNSIYGKSADAFRF